MGKKIIALFGFYFYYFRNSKMIIENTSFCDQFNILFLINKCLFSLYDYLCTTLCHDLTRIYKALAYKLKTKLITLFFPIKVRLQYVQRTYVCSCHT